MGVQNLFGTMLLGAALTPVALLPPTCTVTSRFESPPSTGILSSTLTYSGPFPDGPFIPLQVALTTYTVAVPTEGPNGVIQTRTYTVIASPSVEPIPPTSTPSVPPPLSTNVPNTTYVGCFKDTNGNGGSLLKGPSAMLDTQEACKAFCRTASGGPYRFFSIKPVSDCQCGQNLLLSPGQSMGQCTSGCPGNLNQQCGGPGDDTSVWENPPIFNPPPGPGDRDPSPPGDGVHNFPPYHPGQPHPKPSTHEKPHPPPKSPTYKPHPPNSHDNSNGYPENGHPVKDGYPAQNGYPVHLM